MTDIARTDVPPLRPFVYWQDGMLSLQFNALATQSEMCCDAPDELVMPYTRTMMGFLLFEPRPEKIVMIGLGGGSIAKYCYSRIPTASIVVAEVNPHVVALRDLFRIPGEDERLRIVCQDGAAFVRGAANSTDVLLVDGFDSDGQSAQLCTAHFYDDCYRSLTPHGLLVVNLVVEDPFLERSVARIRRSFDSAVVVESNDRANKVVFASKGNGLCLPHDHLCARLVALEQNHSVDLRDTLQRIRYEQYDSRATI
jgi:spermidine synthase